MLDVGVSCPRHAAAHTASETVNDYEHEDIDDHDNVPEISSKIGAEECQTDENQHHPGKGEVDDSRKQQNRLINGIIFSKQMIIIHNKSTYPNDRKDSEPCPENLNLCSGELDLILGSAGLKVPD